MATETKTFSEWIRDTRLHYGYTIMECAERASMKWQVWQRMETTQSSPRKETLDRVAKGLRVPESEVFSAAGFKTHSRPELTYEPDEDLEVLAAYRGLGDMKPTIKAMILAAHREHQRSQTTHGRRIAEDRATYDANEESQEG